MEAQPPGYGSKTALPDRVIELARIIANAELVFTGVAVLELLDPLSVAAGAVAGNVSRTVAAVAVGIGMEGFGASHSRSPPQSSQNSHGYTAVAIDTR